MDGRNPAPTKLWKDSPANTHQEYVQPWNPQVVRPGFRWSTSAPLAPLAASEASRRCTCRRRRPSPKAPRCRAQLAGGQPAIRVQLKREDAEPGEYLCLVVCVLENEPQLGILKACKPRLVDFPNNFCRAGRLTGTPPQSSLENPANVHFGPSRL